MPTLIKKRPLFLKLIIAHRFSAGTLEIVLGFWVLKFLDQNIDDSVILMCRFMGFDLGNPYVQYLVERASMLGNTTIISVSIMLLSSSLLSYVEGYGLLMRRSWGEWCSVISTTSFIPFEIYAMVLGGITPIKVGILIFNILVIIYLIKHKELFNKRRKRNTDDCCV
jgi:uncharacterized membrane protein (DUF2068 family)